MPLTLYEHQIRAIENLDSGKILVGGVGSGKSRTALAYYWIKECGGSIRINGEGHDIQRQKNVPLYVITTARKRNTKDWEEEGIPLLLSGFTVDSWNNIGKYTSVEHSFFIFDEQRVVGNGTWVKSFLKITKNNRWILLSATPGDTWTDYIPVFLANGFYRNRTAFLEEHAVFSRFAKYQKIERYLGTKKLERLRNEILVLMDFKKPTTPHHEVVPCSYDKDIYKSVMRNRWNPYENLPIFEAGALCYVLRRVVNSDESRFLETKDILDRHGKAVVFYNFDYELEILRSLADYGYSVGEWNGHRHEPIPKTKKWAYLVQYTAGAEGWNCTETDTLIFYSPSYSYKQMVQAAGRIDRMNTPFSDLYYYHLRSAAQIDLAIKRALSQKRNFNEKSFFDKASSKN